MNIPANFATDWHGSMFRIETERVFHHNRLLPDEPVDAELWRPVEHYAVHWHRTEDNLFVRSLNVENKGDKDGLNVVSSPLDDLCIDVWMSVMIIYLSQNSDDKEIGYSNVLFWTNPWTESTLRWTTLQWTEFARSSTSGRRSLGRRATLGSTLPFLTFSTSRFFLECVMRISLTLCYFQCQNWRDPNQHALTK